MSTNSGVPVWLEKYIKTREFSRNVETFKRVNIVSVEEFISRLRDVYWEAGRGKRSFRRKEVARLEKIYREVYSYLKTLANLPSTRFMTDFHKELVESIVGDEYNRALARIRRARDKIRSLYHDYRLLVLTSRSPREAARYRKEGLGRILSVFRELANDIEIIRRIRQEIVNTHIISEGLPVVVVAGPPNSGKSTLVRRVSSARPEIAPYPFTTKNIIVGKTVFRNIPFYIVDTPGLLEAPLEDRNVIEKKAIVALKTIADIVLFLADPTEHASLSAEGQARIVTSLIEAGLARPEAVVVAINKLDITSVERVKKFSNEFTRYSDMEPVIFISALHGINIDKLLERIVEEIGREVARKWALRARF